MFVEPATHSNDRCFHCTPNDRHAKSLYERILAREHTVECVRRWLRRRAHLGPALAANLASNVGGQASALILLSVFALVSYGASVPSQPDCYAASLAANGPDSRSSDPRTPNPSPRCPWLAAVRSPATVLTRTLTAAIHRREFGLRDLWRVSHLRRCMPRWRAFRLGTTRGGSDRIRAEGNVPPGGAGRRTRVAWRRPGRS